VIVAGWPTAIFEASASAKPAITSSFDRSETTRIVEPPEDDVEVAVLDDADEAVVVLDDADPLDVPDDDVPDDDVPDDEVPDDEVPVDEVPDVPDDDVPDDEVVADTDPVTWSPTASSISVTVPAIGAVTVVPTAAAWSSVTVCWSSETASLSAANVAGLM
jgi:hypothetical protein